MIGLDTNVLARYLAQDDPAQARRATHLIESLDEENPGFISLVVLVELHWVLQRAYKINRPGSASIVRKMLDAKELVVQESDIVRRTLAQLTGDADFADALIAEIGSTVGCSHTATFDKRAARIHGMYLL